jgi:hypothetical protein
MNPKEIKLCIAAKLLFLMNYTNAIMYFMISFSLHVFTDDLSHAYKYNIY